MGLLCRAAGAMGRGAGGAGGAEEQKRRAWSRRAEVWLRMMANQLETTAGPAASAELSCACLPRVRIQ
eukprot:1195417-Rhodomonas_salina.2